MVQRRPMSDEALTPALVDPNFILSGLGLLSRDEICRFIALIESVDALSLAQGAITGLGAKLRLMEDQSSKALEVKSIELAQSHFPDAALRHRLWLRISSALQVPSDLPLSKKSSTQAAAALAVRASERLTPAILQERKKQGAPNSRERQLENDAATEVKKELAVVLGEKAADVFNAAKKILEKNQPLPFPDLVKEEMLNLLADADIAKAAAENTDDPEIKRSIEKGHEAAQRALAAGGSWAVFAALVGSAGFAPYILAAQLSAWIPMISGPALVSLLATLISPLTVLVGVGALGWLGMGRGANVLRSQIAARFCVLLAMSGARDAKQGLAQFLDDMRSLDHAPKDAFEHLAKQERMALRAKLAFMNGRLERGLPRSAGPAPQPWDRDVLRSSSKNNPLDKEEAGLAAGVTAGEMLWHAAALDENVLKAADFSRSADLGDPVSFAVHAQEFAIEGAGYALRGYVAERLVLNQLLADGHDVRLAGASNTPGFDLLVDGQPVQVKCGAGLSNLTEHFEKHPDIPVIANEALAKKAAEADADWASLVTTLPGMEIAAIEQQIADTLGHAVSLKDPSVLDVALAISVVRGGYEVVRGDISIEDLPAWLVIDGAAHGTLTFVGGKAGTWVGLVAIGPAGALILGPAVACAALMGTGKLKGAATGLLMRKWAQGLIDHASALHAALISAVEKRIRSLQERLERVSDAAANGDGLSSWIKRRAQDDLIAALEDGLDLSERPQTETQALELLVKAAQLAPYDVEVLHQRSDLEAHLQKKPGLNAAIYDFGNETLNRFASKWSRS